MENYYQKLKRVRIQNNFSYEDMAKKLDISKCYYWQIEHKRRRLYYDMALKIADIFELKPDDLFYETLLLDK